MCMSCALSVLSQAVIARLPLSRHSCCALLWRKHLITGSVSTARLCSLF